MTRGIHIQQSTETTRSHLDLAPDTLQGAMDMAISDGDWTEIDTQAIAREVLATLEDVFDLLSDALPTERG